MRYLLYPGCAMDSSAAAYLDSLRAISGPLDMKLDELDDWNCCGATEYPCIGAVQAHTLVGRNLAIAERQRNGTRTMVAPCSACYLNLAKTDHYMREHAPLGETVNDALAAGDLHYTPGSVDVRHLLDVLVNEIGLDAIEKCVTRPLTGLRVAPYVGCMVPRPDYDDRFSSPDYPDELDRLLGALGAEVIDFPLKAHCCGGHMTQIGPDVAFELIRRLVLAADQYDADLVAALCPMCQTNLDAYQGEMNRHFHTDYHMPVIFFTQLMGLAFGLDPGDVGFGKELVSASDAIARIGLKEERTTTKPSPRFDKGALPRPQSNGPKGRKP